MVEKILYLSCVFEEIDENQDLSIEEMIEKGYEFMILKVSWCDKNCCL